jgi:uncharacterized delta-60 repeat protein
LHEEFLGSAGFTSTYPSLVYIENGVVVWNLTQTVLDDQFIYRDIPAFTGDVRVTVLGQINSHSGNHSVGIGIGDAYGVGPNLSYGWFGAVAGCGASYYIAVRGVSVPPAWQCINGSTPYVARMTIVGGELSIEVDGVGSATGNSDYAGVFDTLWIGQEGNNNTPNASGTIDYVIIEPLGEPYGSLCYTLSTSHSGSGADPSATPRWSLGCPETEYVEDEPVSLTASPNSGWHVSGWSGTDNDASTWLSNTLTMPAGNHTVSVIYSQPSTGGFQLDLTFGGDGIATSESGTNDYLRDVAIQSDGKIVAAGFVQAGSYHNIAVVRYNADGSLDTTFDGDGVVTTPYQTSSQAIALALQDDGKIVVTGLSVGADRNSKDFTTVRYNTDGSLDTTFGGTGIVQTAFGSDFDEAYDLVIQSDGKIVVAGYARLGGTSNDFALARYNTDGSLDTSFDGDGKVTTAVSNSFDEVNGIALQPDGKIVVAGYAWTSNEDYAVVRYNADGSLDTSFSGDGMVTVPVGSSDERITAVAIQPDGKIVVVGNSFLGGSDWVLGLVRFNSDGSLDTSFSGDGVQLGLNNVTASDLILLDGGQILTIGSDIADGNWDFAYTRFNADGSLDTGFGAGGVYTTAVGAGNDYGQALAFQGDGKLVSAGYSHNGADLDFAVLRHTLDQPPAASAIMTVESRVSIFGGGRFAIVSHHPPISAYDFGAGRRLHRLPGPDFRYV